MSELTLPIKDYLLQLSQKNSPRSVEIRKLCLKHLSLYLQERNITRWELCDQKILQCYVIYRRKGDKQHPVFTKGINPTTIRIHFSSIRVFFKYLESHSIIPSNPARFVKLPKVPELLPKVIAVDMMHKLLDQEPVNDLEQRDLTICEVFYSTGMRLSELKSLNVSDVSLVSNEIHVLVKQKRTL